jgi:hypothetical protein
LASLTATTGDGNRVHLDDAHGLDCVIRYGERWRGAATRALVAMGLRPPEGGDCTMSGASGDMAPVGAAASSGAVRMARHRDRRRKGLRCITVELRETEVDVLIRRGQLSHDDRADPAAIRKALYAFLDDTLQ